MLGCGGHTIIVFTCLYTHSPGPNGRSATREVSLTLKHGVEAKNYDDVSVVAIICCLLNPARALVEP